MCGMKANKSFVLKKIRIMIDYPKFQPVPFGATFFVIIIIIFVVII
jgi:hypothetical protein